MKETLEEQLHQAHDAYGKESLSRKEVAIDCLKGHLPKDILDCIDLSSLELTNSDFVDDYYQCHNDVAYKVRVNEEESYIVFFIEIQRAPEKLMPFRMLRYMVLFWTTYLRQHKRAATLPAILPICLYNGKTTYPFSTSMYDCLGQPNLMRQHKVLEEFILWDLNQYTVEELLEHGEAALFEILFKGTSEGDFASLLSRFTPAFLSSLDTSYLYNSTRYISYETDEEKGKAAYKVLIEKIADENKRRSIMTFADSLVKKGRQEGRQETLFETAKNLLKQGVALDIIAKATGLKKDQLAQLSY